MFFKSFNSSLLPIIIAAVVLLSDTQASTVEVCENNCQYEVENVVQTTVVHPQSTITMTVYASTTVSVTSTGAAVPVNPTTIPGSTIVEPEPAINPEEPGDSEDENASVMRGVNLGGLFVLEPWITPTLFQEWKSDPNSNVVDEWSYCKALGKYECSQRLHAHWNTWVTESDISELAGMGINTLRIPIGYWALVPLNSDEPYVQGQIPYLKRVLQWATAYNLQVILDLHGVPGSQNGFDNSGHRGEITWTQHEGDIQRSIESITHLANIANEFPIVKAIQAVNEPANWGISKQVLADYHARVYHTVKSLSPHSSVMFHDAFLKSNQWNEIIPSNVTDSFVDTHIYHVFVDEFIRMSEEQHIQKACNDGYMMSNFNSRASVVCGEFSLATTDCALWLNGFQRGSRWDGTYLTSSPIQPNGSCQGQEDMTQWNNQKKNFMRNFALAQFQAYETAGGWIFWNFKTESADSWNFMKLSQAGIIPNPPIGSSHHICQ